MTQRFCEQCGSRLPAGARFCEQCGSPLGPAQPSSPGERTVGHVPVRFEGAGAGQAGRAKRGDYELVITGRRLLLVRGPLFEDETWLQEQSELEELAELSGAPWREVAETYDLGKELWQPLYTVPPDDMLGWHKANVALPIEAVLAATVTIDPEGALDTLVLRLADGAELRFTIYLTLGRPAVRFLEEALGPGRAHTQG